MPQSLEWDRFFYFPFGGRHAEDFYARKNPTTSAGFEPVNLGSRVHSVTNILLMNKEKCALKLVDEIILYYDARLKKHQITGLCLCFDRR